MLLSTTANGSFSLNAGTNDITGNLAANTGGAINFTNSGNALTVGTVGITNGVTTANASNVTLTAIRN